MLSLINIYSDLLSRILRILHESSAAKEECVSSDQDAA